MAKPSEKNKRKNGETKGTPRNKSNKIITLLSL